MTLLLTLLLAGAAPPPPLTPEQADGLRRRDELLKEAARDWQAGRRDAAVAALSGAIEAQHRVTGPWDVKAIHLEGQAAKWSYEREDWPGVERHRRRRLAGLRVLYGERHWEVGGARLDVEDAVRQARLTPEERSALRRADQLGKEMVALSGRGDGAKALHLGREALALRARVLGERHPLVGVAMNNLANLARDAGDPRAALGLIERAIPLIEGVCESHPFVARALRFKASLLSSLGDDEAAAATLRRVVAIFAEIEGPTGDQSIATLLDLGQSLANAGDLRRASAPLNRSLALVRAKHGDRHPDYAAALHALASLHHRKGERRQALTLYREALALRKELFGERHVLAATTMNNLALLLRDMGDYKAALPLQQQAVAVYKVAVGERHPSYAVNLHNLALLLQEMGDRDGAIRELTLSMEVTRKTLGGTHPQFAAAGEQLARFVEEIGRRADARRLVESALAVRERARGERSPAYAAALLYLARLHSADGAHLAARPLYQRALAVAHEAVGEGHPDTAHGYAGLARLHLALRRPEAALLLSEQALRVSRAAREAVVFAQSEREQLAAARPVREFLDLRLSIPDAGPNDAYAHVLSWKGQGYELARRRRLFASGFDPGSRPARLATRIEALSRRLAALTYSGGAARREELERLTAQKEALEAELALLSAEYREAGGRVAPATLAAALPAGAVLVDYLFHSGGLSAFVVRKGSAPARVGLGPGAPIAEAIVAWRRALEAGRDDRGAAGKLRRLVWDPLRDHLAGVGVILVSPDGPLTRLPFAALPGSKADTFLIEEAALAVLPIPQALPGLLRPAAGPPSLLAVGGVAFGAGGTWAELPATRPEAAAVAAGLGGRSELLSGAAATKDALRVALPRVRYAHLATHGFFAPPTMKSGLAGEAGWDPGLLSGLVLAGANKPSDADDGILTALEIAEMDLSKLELAVLSACQTGLGLEAAGEGMLGLQRAFAVAGCKSVVSSLWSVNDAATAVLMGRFYHHLWERKLSKLEALRQAQIDILRHPGWVEERVKKLTGTPGLRGAGKASEVIVSGKKERRSPPAWWGAWQLSGDWR